MDKSVRSALAGKKLSEAKEARGGAKAMLDNAQQALEGRQSHRQHSVDKLKGFASTGLLAVAIADLAIPDPNAPWTIEPALVTAGALGTAPAWFSASAAQAGDKFCIGLRQPFSQWRRRAPA